MSRRRPTAQMSIGYSACATQVWNCDPEMDDTAAVNQYSYSTYYGSNAGDGGGLLSTELLDELEFPYQFDGISTSTSTVATGLPL